MAIRPDDRPTRLPVAAAYAVIGVGWMGAAVAIANLVPVDGREAVVAVAGFTLILLTAFVTWIALRGIGSTRQASPRGAAKEPVASEAEQRLALVLRASPAAIIALDAEDRVVAWSRAAERMFGWRAEEVSGRPCPLLDGPADGLDLADRLGAVTLPADPGTWAADAPGQVAGVELSLRNQDGRQLPCRVHAAQLAAAAGGRPGLVAVIEDRRAEIERDQAQARLASAIDAAGEAIVITDLQGTMSYVNPAFERVSGYRREELVGQNPRILQSGLTSASVYADMWQRLRAGQVWHGVLFNRRRDGSLFEEEATLTPVFGADGRVIAYVGVKRDLTLERTLSAGLATELNDRATVQETMARLDLADSPADVSQLLCEALAGFPDVDDAVIEQLPSDGGRSVVIGIAGAAAHHRRRGDELTADRTARLRVRAAAGAWSTGQAGGLIGHTESDDQPGLTTVAAPVRHRGIPVAVLQIGARTDAPDAWVARYLRIVSELAAHVSPIVGPALAQAARDTSEGHVAS